MSEFVASSAGLSTPSPTPSSGSFSPLLSPVASSSVVVGGIRGSSLLSVSPSCNVTGEVTVVSSVELVLTSFPSLDAIGSLSVANTEIGESTV